MSPDLPVLTLVLMGAAALICVAIPIVLLIVFKKKGADVLPFFIGCAVFFLFALLIEGLINFAVSRLPLGEKISGNMILYGVYGGLMAGIFEETGRFLAFRTVLKRRLGNDKNALMYGAGHGGFEAVMLISVNYVTYAALIVMNSLGTLSKIVPEEAMEQVLPVLAAFTDLTSPWLILLAVVERVLAITAHISFSVFVWFGAKSKKRRYLFPATILLHALYDFIAVIAAQHFRLPALAVEGIVLLITVLIALGAYGVYKKCHE